ncbi:MAG: hypothetical protein HWE25_13800 [Alphaproteobacteria bacterium]|nr:hypothetical protein [Alphaproteobacteria bacterium]
MMKQVFIGSFALCAFAMPAAAQDDGGLAIDGYVGVVSDFRDRGLSLSDKDPAVVASVGAFADSGFYGGVVGAYFDGTVGADTKLEFYGGYQIDKGDYIYDFSVELDTYHGEGSSDLFPEFKASVARDFGLAFVRAGAAYAPDGRWNLPDNDSLYIFTDLEVPVPTMPELTLIGRIGHDFRQDRSNLWDWGIGLSAFINQVEVSLMYENSSLDHSAGDGRLVLGARLYF